MTPHNRVWHSIKPTLIVAAVFSMFVNLMLLAPILYMLQIFDRVLASRSLPTLWMLTLIVAIALLAMAFVDLARSRLLGSAGRIIDELLGQRVLKHLIRAASSFNHNGYMHGLKDIALLRGFLTGSNVIALFDAPWLILFILIIFLFHPLMGLTALLGSMVLIILTWINESANRKDLEKYQEITRRAGQFMDQGIRNSDVLNSMGMTARFADKWHSINLEALSCLQETSNRMGILLSLSKFARQIIQIVILGQGVYLVIHDNLSPGIMIAGSILLGRALAPVESLIGNWNGLVAARAAFLRLQALFPVLFEEPVRQELPPLVGHVQLEKVSLSGSFKDRPILRQVDLQLPAGRSLAILGPSGSGKSSLAKMLAGVWRPTSGHVRIDSADLGQWRSSQLGPQIGYLPQDVELFPGSIGENIGRFDAGNSEEVIRAAKSAHAFELILSLPEGFDTQLGRAGFQLSAGQAQRIGLARALYGSPRIVVLDEPNANLDAEGEQALLQALDELKSRNATVILVTHKPALVADMDFLMVMRDGAVQFQGRREEVLAKLGIQMLPRASENPGAGRQTP